MRARKSPPRGARHGFKAGEPGAQCLLTDRGEPIGIAMIVAFQPLDETPRFRQAIGAVQCRGRIGRW